MEQYPKTLIEFEKQFTTDEACRDYLVQVRWPNGFQCPQCQGREFWKTSRQLYHCVNCGHQTSVTAGTIFQDTRYPLKIWFMAIWYVVSQKNGISALGLQRVLGFTRHQTAWNWLHRLRKAMVRPGRERLSGVVEVDEAYIGGKHKGKRGRGSEGKSLVFIAAEDKDGRIGRIRLRLIPDASKESLIPAIQETVASASIVRSDGWKGYINLSSKGYQHEVIRQSADVGENLLPLVHIAISLLKRWLLGTHQGAVHQSHLEYYLDEFTFRFNRRTSRSRGKLFYRLIQQAVATAPSKARN
jgi:transposase-like protein/Zn ribbon nucleic-acid-binding protein